MRIIVCAIIFANMLACDSSEGPVSPASGPATQTSDIPARVDAPGDSATEATTALSPDASSSATLPAGGANLDAAGPPAPPSIDSGNPSSLAHDAANTDAALAQSDCVNEPISWGWHGAGGAYEDTYSLSPCRLFQLSRMRIAENESNVSCENVVPTDGAVTVVEVNAMLANPDLKAAVLRAPVLYGLDHRATDSPEFRIQVGTAIIELGDACNDTPNCVPIAEGLEAARTTLKMLQLQQRALPGCTSIP